MSGNHDSNVTCLPTWLSFFQRYLSSSSRTRFQVVPARPAVCCGSESCCRLQAEQDQKELVTPCQGDPGYPKIRRHSRSSRLLCLFIQMMALPKAEDILLKTSSMKWYVLWLRRGVGFLLWGIICWAITSFPCSSLESIWIKYDKNWWTVLKKPSRLSDIHLQEQRESLSVL